MQYILNVQRTMGAATMLEVGYGGSVSRHLDYLSDQNQGILSPSLPGGSTLALPRMGRFGHSVPECRRYGNYNALSGKLSQRFGRA